MTKAMRWGVSALLILGGVGVGSFMGCSSDDEPAPVDTGDTGTGEETSTDTGTDTGTAEETSTDTGSMTDAPTDAPAFKADRAATLLMAAPDLAPQYVCLAAFLAAPADVATKEPADALLIGIPDATAPTDESKYSPIPYGAVLPLPLNAKALAALKSLTVVVYVTATKPMSSADCKTGWAAAKTDTKKWKAFDKNAIDTGDHALLAVTGCAGAGGATTTECGAGNNLEITLKKADTTKATTFTGESTGPKVGIDFVNLSRYAGAGSSGPGSWQGIDAYLVFSKSVPVTLDAGTDDSGDATTADGGMTVAPDVANAVKIADNKSYGDIVPVVGVQAGDLPDDTYLVVVPHGAVLATSAPCSSAPGPTCAAYIPFKPFLAALKPAGAGFKDGENQFVALTGGPIPKGMTDAGAPDPTTAPIRILMGNADKPAP
jgi:hypothetical protein